MFTCKILLFGREVFKDLDRKQCSDCGAFFDGGVSRCPFCENRRQSGLFDFKKRWVI